MNECDQSILLSAADCFSTFLNQIKVSLEYLPSWLPHKPTVSPGFRGMWFMKEALARELRRGWGKRKKQGTGASSGGLSLAQSHKEVWNIISQHLSHFEAKEHCLVIGGGVCVLGLEDASHWLWSTQNMGHGHTKAEAWQHIASQRDQRGAGQGISNFCHIYITCNLWKFSIRKVNYERTMLSILDIFTHQEIVASFP